MSAPDTYDKLHMDMLLYMLEAFAKPRPYPRQERYWLLREYMARRLSSVEVAVKLKTSPATIRVQACRLRHGWIPAYMRTP